MKKIIESRYDREDEGMFRSIQTRLLPWSRYSIEKKAIDIYTRNLQLKFTSFDLDEVKANGLC